jgi:hypothetical protein
MSQPKNKLNYLKGNQADKELGKNKICLEENKTYNKVQRG